MTPAESHLRAAVENGYPHHTLTIKDGRELVAELDRITRERDEARAERDALAKALKGMLALEQEGLRGDDDIDICYEMQQARAALAQIEQEQPK